MMREKIAAEGGESSSRGTGGDGRGRVVRGGGRLEAALCMEKVVRCGDIVGGSDLAERKTRWTSVIR